MARHFRFSFFLSILLACLRISSAQRSALPPTQPSQPNGAIPITLGQSVVPLNGPWKFKTGDSPMDPATHKYLLAEPGFDDSNWEAMDLTPSASELIADALERIIGVHEGQSLRKSFATAGNPHAAE